MDKIYKDSSNWWLLPKDMGFCVSFEELSKFSAEGKKILTVTIDPQLAAVQEENIDTIKEHGLSKMLPNCITIKRGNILDGLCYRTRKISFRKEGIDWDLFK
jgi:hypothetical protein